MNNPATRLKCRLSPEYLPCVSGVTDIQNNLNLYHNPSIEKQTPFDRDLFSVTLN